MAQDDRETGEQQDNAAQAWEEFASELVSQLQEMDDDDHILVELPDDDDGEGATPYVQFCPWGQVMVRAEAVSNHYLAAGWRLTPQDRDALEKIGFAAPTYAPDEEPDPGSANFWVDVERTELDDLARMTVAALRDVYGVPHPSLLEAPGIVAPAPPEPDHPAPLHGHGASDGAGVSVQAHVPRAPEELQALVDEVMEQVLGHPPHKDTDGDIPVSTDHATVYVCVHPVRPVVDVWAVVLHDLSDHDLALHEVAVLNRDDADLKYVLRGSSVIVQARVSARPFAPAHLREVVESVCTAADRAYEDLAPRFKAVAGDDED